MGSVRWFGSNNTKHLAKGRASGDWHLPYADLAGLYAKVGLFDTFLA
jgi:hypothetical protein